MYTVEKILSIARAELGYHEKNSDANLDSKTAPNDGNGNHTKYACDLRKAGYYNGDKCGYAWCDVFVDWLFWKLCGENAVKAQAMEYQTGLLGAGCTYSAQYYKQAGRYFASDPQPGDQIFFGRNGVFEHTGIVEAVAGGTITTIEGNSNNQVERRTYNVGSGYILGYGRPNYEKEEAEMTKEEVKKLCAEAVREAMNGKGTGNDQSDYAKEATNWAVKNGIVFGFGGDDMGWQKLMTREQFVAILYRFAKYIGKI